MKFFTSKNKKLPPEAQKGLLPRKEFVAQGKERFLAAFDASEFAANARTAHSPGLAIFFKIGIGAMAALCIAVGLSAYADTANVSATSPLYPLKRISENVRLELAPASEKPQLQATLAVRRANEIAALQTSQPSSTLIPALTSNLDQEIQSSLGVSTNIAPEATSTTTSSTSTGTPMFVSASSSLPSSSVAASMGVYCSAFDVSTSGVLMGQLENKLALHAGAFAQFNERCGYDAGDHSANSTTTTTTTIITTHSFGHRAGAHSFGGL